MVALIYNHRLLEDTKQHRPVKSGSLKLLTSVGFHYIKRVQFGQKKLSAGVSTFSMVLGHLYLQEKKGSRKHRLPAAYCTGYK